MIYDLRLIPELKTSLFLLKNFSGTSSSDHKITGGTFVVQEYSTPVDKIPGIFNVEAGEASYLGLTVTWEQRIGSIFSL